MDSKVIDSKIVKEEKTATIITLLFNIFLFFLKLVAGFLSGSVAVISDSINSLTDSIVSLIIIFSVKVSRDKPDKDHPFGHHRAQPIAALIVAIFTAVVGFELAKFSIEKILFGKIQIVASVAIVALAITIAIKLGLFFYLSGIGKKANSPAIKASAIDARNDVLISSTAVVGVAGSFFGFSLLDPIVALFISAYVIKAGYEIARENIDFLMGKSPPKELIQKICLKAKSVEGVIGLNDVYAHYIGTYIQVEVHIELDKAMSLTQAHNIAKQVEKEVESLGEVTNCFVHIDPI
jgi:cation diffusion facilitator family transporter